MLGLGAMVSWTTNVAEIAPAVATLGAPLRLLRIRSTSGRSHWRSRYALSRC
ncbi:hypothetical protein I552_9779 [Mycobacterium xenopi 3993]|nr:hypothetical protein I552_9779 [Mycobacterium xenopi 3993]